MRDVFFFAIAMLFCTSISAQDNYFKPGQHQRLSLKLITNPSYNSFIVPAVGLGVEYSTNLSQGTELYLGGNYAFGISNGFNNGLISEGFSTYFDEAGTKTVLDINAGFNFYFASMTGAFIPYGLHSKFGLTYSQSVHTKDVTFSNPDTGNITEEFEMTVNALNLTLGIGKNFPLKNNWMIGFDVTGSYPLLSLNTDFEQENIDQDQFSIPNRGRYFISDGLRANLMIGKKIK